MMGEVEQKLLHAEQNVRFSKHIELYQLANEPAHLEFGLNLNLILFPNLPSEILFQHGTKLDWNVRHARRQSCYKTSIKWKKVGSISVHGEESFNQTFCSA